jgi:hypothetical protein
MQPSMKAKKAAEVVEAVRRLLPYRRSSNAYFESREIVRLFQAPKYVHNHFVVM